MFIGQGSSIIGVCVVYCLNSLVHPFYCLYKPLIDKKKEENNTSIQKERREHSRDIHNREKYLREKN
jgi:hypothetical protein